MGIEQKRRRGFHPVSSVVLSVGFALTFSILEARAAPLEPIDVDPDLSTIELIPPDGVPATGQDEIQIVVTLRNSSGQPVPGALVTVSSPLPEDVIAQAVAPSNQNGQTRATIASTHVGGREISVTATQDSQGILLNDKPVVVFSDPPGRPNVIIILIDDVGTDFLSMYDDINPYRTDLPYVHGEPGEGDIPANGVGTSNLYVSSPAIQSLADEGVTFMNAYAMPVCSPTRACILTGEYPIRNGVGTILRFDHDGGTLDEFGDPGFESPTIPQLVQQEGYDDATFGKWHLGAPTLAIHPTEGKDYHLGWATIPERGHFSEWYAVFNGVNTVPDPPGTTVGTYYDWVWNRNHTTQAQVDDDPESHQTTYATIVQFEEALQWCNTRTEPFFCLISPNAAHGPWNLLPPEYMTNTAEYMGAPLNGFSGHCAMLEALDTQIGEFMNGLTPAVRQNTLFILMGDNGTQDTCLLHARSESPVEDPSFPSGMVEGSNKNLGATYDYMLDAPTQRFKHSVYEKGVRIPMIVAGYGVENGGRISSALVDAVDVFPTVVELLDLSVAGEQAGVSFMPVLRDEVDYFTHERDYSFTEYFSPTGNTNPGTVFTERRVACSMIIPGQGRYKLVRDEFGLGEDEFYRLQFADGSWDDPFETRDLPHGPADPEWDNYNLVKDKMEAVIASGDETGPNFCESDESFCSSTPNSTGYPAVMSVTGSCSVVLNNMVLMAGPVPEGFGIFYYAAGQVNGGDGVPFGNGLRCVGGGYPVQRLPLVYTTTGTMSRGLDITNPPSSAGQIAPGTTWHFQAWFRDPAGGGAEFDLSDGISVTFGI